MTVIYVDILLLINVYVNYFLIKATNAFLHRKVAPIRCILGAFVGSLFALAIFLPNAPFVITVLIKLLAALLIVLLVYGKQSIRTYCKIAMVFFGINFVFAGVMLGLWWFVCPLNMYYNNGVVYFDISFLTLVVSTILAYFAVKAVRFLLDSKGSLDEHFKVIVNNCKSTVELDAFVDSGNTLVDAFSGMPVIVCDLDQLECVLPLQYRLAFERNDIADLQELVATRDGLKGVRLLPYNTINACGVIPSFKVDGVYIKGERMHLKPVKALIGISPSKLGGGDYGAILSPKLLL